MCIYTYLIDFFMKIYIYIYCTFYFLQFVIYKCYLLTFCILKKTNIIRFYMLFSNHQSNIYYLNIPKMIIIIYNSFFMKLLSINISK